MGARAVGVPGGRAVPERATGFMERGTCVVEDINLSIFYPSQGQSVLPAKLVCARCPVRLECLAWALEGSDQFAILGGTTEAERRKMRKLGVMRTDLLMPRRVGESGLPRELTHCRNGHRLYLDRAGRLRCRQCESLSAKTRSGGERTHCRDGHPLHDGKGGRKRCRVCDKLGRVRRKALRARPEPVEAEVETYCSQGHRHYIGAGGRKRCQVCEAARSRARAERIKNGEHVASRRARTHCSRGHELSSDASGHLRCQKCPTHSSRADCGHETYLDTAKRRRCHTCDSNSQRGKPRRIPVPEGGFPPRLRVCDFCKRRKIACKHKSRREV